MNSLLARDAVLLTADITGEDLVLSIDPNIFHSLTVRCQAVEEVNHCVNGLFELQVCESLVKIIVDK